MRGLTLAGSLLLLERKSKSVIFLLKQMNFGTPHRPEDRSWVTVTQEGNELKLTLTIKQEVVAGGKGLVPENFTAWLMLEGTVI